MRTGGGRPSDQIRQGRRVKRRSRPHTRPEAHHSAPPPPCPPSTGSPCRAAGSAPRAAGRTAPAAPAPRPAPPRPPAAEPPPLPWLQGGEVGGWGVSGEDADQQPARRSRCTPLTTACPPHKHAAFIAQAAEHSSTPPRRHSSRSLPRPHAPHASFCLPASSSAASPLCFSAADRSVASSRCRGAGGARTGQV